MVKRTVGTQTEPEFRVESHGTPVPIEIPLHVQKMTRFFSLEWTFTKRFQFLTSEGASTVLVSGSGPYIYAIMEKPGAPAGSESFAFGSQLCVFEATGTYVRGVENLNNGLFNLIFFR